MILNQSTKKATIKTLEKKYKKLSDSRKRALITGAVDDATSIYNNEQFQEVQVKSNQTIVVDEYNDIQSRTNVVTKEITTYDTTQEYRDMGKLRLANFIKNYDLTRGISTYKSILAGGTNVNDAAVRIINSINSLNSVEIKSVFNRGLLHHIDKAFVYNDTFESLTRTNELFNSKTTESAKFSRLKVTQELYNTCKDILENNKELFNIFTNALNCFEFSEAEYDHLVVHYMLAFGYIINYAIDNYNRVIVNNDLLRLLTSVGSVSNSNVNTNYKLQANKSIRFEAMCNEYIDKESIYDNNFQTKSTQNRSIVKSILIMSMFMRDNTIKTYKKTENSFKVREVLEISNEMVTKFRVALADLSPMIIFMKNAQYPYRTHKLQDTSKDSSYVQKYTNRIIREFLYNYKDSIFEYSAVKDIVIDIQRSSPRYNADLKCSRYVSPEHMKVFNDLDGCLPANNMSSVSDAILKVRNCDDNLYNKFKNQSDSTKKVIDIKHQNQVTSKVIQRVFSYTTTVEVINKLLNVQNNTHEFIRANCITKPNVLDFSTELSQVIGTLCNNECIISTTYNNNSGRQIYSADGFDFNNMSKYIRNTLFEGKVQIDINACVWQYINVALERIAANNMSTMNVEFKKVKDTVQLLIDNKTVFRNNINIAFDLPANSGFAKEITSVISMTKTNFSEYNAYTLVTKLYKSNVYDVFEKYDIVHKFRDMPIMLINLMAAVNLVINSDARTTSAIVSAFGIDNTESLDYYKTHITIDESGRMLVPNMQLSGVKKDAFNRTKLESVKFNCFETATIDAFIGVMHQNSVEVLCSIHDCIIVNSSDLDLIESFIPEELLKIADIKLIDPTQDLDIYLNEKLSKNSNKSGFVACRSGKSTHKPAVRRRIILANTEGTTKNVKVRHENRLNYIEVNNKLDNLTDYETQELITTEASADYCKNLCNVTTQISEEITKNVTNIQKKLKRNYLSYDVITSLYKATNNTDKVSFIDIDNAITSPTFMSILHTADTNIHRWDIARQKAIHENDNELLLLLFGAVLFDFNTQKYIISKKATFNHTNSKFVNLILFLNGNKNYINSKLEWYPAGQSVADVLQLPMRRETSDIELTKDKIHLLKCKQARAKHRALLSKKSKHILNYNNSVSKQTRDLIGMDV